MANEWMSTLPSAWKPQDPNAQVQAAQSGANTAMASAQAGGAAVAAEAANQDRIRKQALQDVMARSVISKTRGGKVVHEFDNDRFQQNLQSSPAALDAYKAWSETIMPQQQKLVENRAVAAQLTPEGGIDPTKIVETAQANPDFAASVFSQGVGNLRTLSGAASEVAGNRVATGAMATPGGLAPMESAQGLSQIVPKQFGDVSAGQAVDEATVSSVIGGDPAARASAIQRLVDAGQPVPPNASDAQIAAATNALAAAKVRALGAGVDVKQPGSMANVALSASAKAPSVIQDALGSVFGDKYALVQKKLGIQGSQLNVTGGEQAQDLVQSLRQQGFNANPGNAAKIQETKAAFDWLSDTSKEIEHLKKKVAKGEKISDDTFHNTIAAMENAPMVAESISNLAGQKRFLEGIRTSPSYGALIKSADGNPASFLRALASAKLGAQDQATVLDQLGTIVETQLKTGKAKNDLDQYRIRSLKPSVFDKPAAQPDGRRKATAEDF